MGKRPWHIRTFGIAVGLGVLQGGLLHREENQRTQGPGPLFPLLRAAGLERGSHLGACGSDKYSGGEML